MNDTKTAGHPAHREQLGQWLNQAGLTGSMVEIGCAFGGFARIVLKQWRGREYVMVDPWITQPREVYKERTDGIPYDSWYNQCVELAKEDVRVHLRRCFSVEAAPLFPDGHFDCVYIDGNHCMEAVTQDLTAWWPKLKSGGLFSGHDFYDVTHSGHYSQVETAVRTWTAAAGLTVQSTECSSWWILKP